MIKIGELELELGTMLVQLVAFLILLALVLKFAMKPAMKVLNDRQNYIHTQITSAEEANKEAQRLVDEQRAVLANAKKEAHELIELAKQQKDREAEQIMKAAQERAEQLVQIAVQDIENEKLRAIAELRDEVGSLSIQLASKIIEKEVDVNVNRNMIDDFLKQVGGRV